MTVYFKLGTDRTLLQTKLKCSHPFNAKTFQKASLFRQGGWPGRKERETGAKEKPKKWEEKERKRGRKNGGEKYLLCFLHPKK